MTLREFIQYIENSGLNLDSSIDHIEEMNFPDDIQIERHGDGTVSIKEFIG